FVVVSGHENAVCVRSQTAVPCPGAMKLFCGVARDSEIRREATPPKGGRGDFADLVNFFRPNITQFNSLRQTLLAIAAPILAQGDHGHQYAKADFFESAKQCRVVR